jgi:hypothetical protein
MTIQHYVFTMTIQHYVKTKNKVGTTMMGVRFRVGMRFKLGLGLRLGLVLVLGLRRGAWAWGRGGVCRGVIG